MQQLQNIDPNKVFFVNFSELEGRLDPSIYRPQFKFISSKYRNVKLSEIAWIDPTCNFVKTKEVSFVPMDAIDSVNGAIAYQGLKKVEETKGFTRFKEGDILWAKITPCMQNAKSAIAKNLLNGYGCGSTEFFVIRTKDKNVVSQEYLLFLLRDDKILKSAMNYFGGSAGQQRVSPLFLKTFNVPLPNIDEQNHFCEIVRNAQKSKHQKEQQAEALLNSIDNYLLGELGVTLPQKDAYYFDYCTESQTEYGIHKEFERDENNIHVREDKVFITNFSEVCGNRLDPFYYQKKYKVIDDIIDKLSNKCYLGDVINKLNNGIEVRDYIENGYRYLRVTDLGKNELNNSSPRYININEIPGRIKLNENCILVSRSGSLGLINEVNTDMLDYVLSSHIFKVELKNELINPKFAVEILRNKICQEQIFRNNNGGIIPEIQQNALKSIRIPLPPLEKQQKIVDHITAIRQQAKALQEEGKTILEDAKKEVERMILGNE